jgi:hypothetical protein
MAEKLKVWFDAEGDFLEVRFSDAPGFMRATTNDALMERVDGHGQVSSALAAFVRSGLLKRP